MKSRDTRAEALSRQLAERFVGVGASKDQAELRSVGELPLVPFLFLSFPF